MASDAPTDAKVDATTAPPAAQPASVEPAVISSKDQLEREYLRRKAAWQANVIREIAIVAKDAVDGDKDSEPSVFVLIAQYAYDIADDLEFRIDEVDMLSIIRQEAHIATAAVGFADPVFAGFF